MPKAMHRALERSARKKGLKGGSFVGRNSIDTRDSWRLELRRALGVLVG